MTMNILGGTASGSLSIGGLLLDNMDLETYKKIDPTKPTSNGTIVLNTLLLTRLTLPDPAGFDPDLIWEGSSYMKKYDDKYSLVLSVKNEATGVVNETTVTKTVDNFIDVNGVVIPELIEAVVSKMHDSLTSQRKDINNKCALFIWKYFDMWSCFEFFVILQEITYFLNKNK